MIYLKVALVGPHLVVLGGIPAAEDWWEGDDGWSQPRANQHECYHSLGHVDGILERLDDGVIAVHADAAQVEDRGSGEVHVQRVPDVTHELGEHPVARQLKTGVERHDGDGHQDVCEREGHDEIVGDYPELAMPHHTHHDQEVAEDGTDDDHSHHGGFEHKQQHISPFLFFFRYCRVHE